MSLTERDFQKQVMQIAQLGGWMVAHFRPAQTANGWRTPVSGDGQGFPDLVLVRPPAHKSEGFGRVIFAELKTEIGRVTPHQLKWLKTLQTTMCEVYIWRPSDMEQIEDVLLSRKRVA